MTKGNEEKTVPSYVQDIVTHNVRHEVPTLPAISVEEAEVMKAALPYGSAGYTHAQLTQSLFFKSVRGDFTEEDLQYLSFAMKREQLGHEIDSAVADKHWLATNSLGHEYDELLLAYPKQMKRDQVYRAEAYAILVGRQAISEELSA